MVGDMDEKWLAVLIPLGLLIAFPLFWMAIGVLISFWGWRWLVERGIFFHHVRRRFRRSRVAVLLHGRDLEDHLRTASGGRFPLAPQVR